MVKANSQTDNTGKPKTSGRHKIRPRPGDWGFIVRGKGKPQNLAQDKN